MIRELLRLAWRTLRDRPPSTPDAPVDERPGSDEQWGTYPRIRITDYYPNPEHQQDKDERRYRP